MIRSLLTLGATVALCVLLAGCSESDPAASGRDKGPRPEVAPQPAPDLAPGSDKAQSGAPGGGARGTTGGTTGGGG
jgi:hypothetical protein